MNIFLEMFFWPISEIKKLIYVATLMNKENELPGFNAGIVITFGFLIVGGIIGTIISSPLPILENWVCLYFIGGGLEGIMRIVPSDGLTFPACWWTRIFLDGLCLGLTLQYLVMPW